MNRLPPIKKEGDQEMGHDRSTREPTATHALANAPFVVSFGLILNGEVAAMLRRSGGELHRERGWLEVVSYPVWSNA